MTQHPIPLRSFHDGFLFEIHDLSTFARAPRKMDAEISLSIANRLLVLQLGSRKILIDSRVCGDVSPAFNMIFFQKLTDLIVEEIESQLDQSLCMGNTLPKKP
jgi:hypothetical protein